MRRFFFDSYEPPVPLWRPLLLGSIVVFLVAGCGQTSFVGRQYDNFTAYYNKFYNARNAFEEGVEAIQDQDRSIDRTEYVSVFLEPQGTAAGTSFEEAIQKSADVLREHPNSKWVDDALLLIGKSYFYQQNYVGAAQKFREVLALDGERKRESRFWLARTLVTNERYSEAAEVLRGAEEEEQRLENPWTARLFLVQGELLVRQQQWQEAETVLMQGLRGELPDEIAARGAFLLGQVRETIEKPREAQIAYRLAHEYDPPYELSFAARLSEIELQGEHGNPSEALERLRSLDRDDKNRDKRGEMALVRARIYRAQGEPERARAALRNVLYGNESPSSTATGRLHYDLATLYRDEYKDFSRAAAHFDTASTRLSQSGGQQQERVRQQLPAAPVDAASEADRYGNLADRSEEIARLDSLLRVGRMSDEEFQAFVKEVKRRREEALAAQRERENASGGRRLQNRGQVRGQQGRGEATAADTRDSDAGFLFHKDPAQVQQGRQRFAQIWGDRPRVDNWRRRNAMRTAPSSSTGASRTVAEESEEGTGESTTGAPSALDLSDIPRDSASQAEMEAERAVARYELANSLFLAAGRPDSAATWYRRILQENGDHPVARRALYALAEAYRARGDTTAAEQTYRRLVEQYPGTALAERGRERLGQQQETEPVDDRRALADTAYAQAYERWQQGKWRSALDSMFTVVRRYPDTDAAPRALLASSIIYWQRVQADSSAVPYRRVARYVESISSDSTGPEGKVPRLAENTLPGGQADSSGWRLDSLAMEGTTGESAVSTVREVPDSLTTTADSTSADSASTATEVDRYAPLDTLLSYLVERYPDAPQVERARSMMEVLEERRAPADSVAADSVAREEPSDSAAIAASDETENQASPTQPPPRTDTLRSNRSATPDDEETSSEGREEPLPAPGAPSRGDDGGSETWTLFVQRYSQAEGASALITTLERQLGEEWTIEVVRDPDAEMQPYLLVIGEFESEKAALQAQEQISGQMGGSLQVRQKP